MEEKAVDTIAPEDAVKTGESLGGFAWFMFKLALIVLIIRSFIFSPFSIPSESMLPRLWDGDFLLAAKWPYGYSNHSLPFNIQLISGRLFAAAPERGDIIIFKHPIDKVDYIKRVIGLPGDIIEIRNGRIILNGEKLKTRRIHDFTIPLSANSQCDPGGRQMRDATGKLHCRYTQFEETLPSGKTYKVLDFGLVAADNRPPIVVPAGRIFVMGDNRDNSQDSRFKAISGKGVGLVPQGNLVGRASIIMWSSDGSAQWASPSSWFSSIRWGRIGEVL